MLKRFTQAIVCSLMLTAGAAQADATADLTKLLSGYDSLKADFQQYTATEGGGRQQKTSGHFVLAKPIRFDWVTDKPYEQRIVSDGQYIWIYDPDLEQVTRKPAKGEAGNAPSMILSGDVKALSQDYSVQKLDPESGHEVYELIPRKANGSFSRIRLLFDQKTLSELMLEDSLGQRTVIILSNVTVNPKVDSSEFHFVPPKGVDLILDPGA